MRSDGLVATDAFVPDKRTADKRSDGGQEVSVNWEDTPEVESFTLRSNNAQHGAARIKRANIAALPRTDHRAPVTCERDELPDNRFHGNLVFQSHLPAYAQKQVAAAIALGCVLVPRPPKASKRRKTGE